MKRLIGIRVEDKNKWEKRTPLVPEDVKRLIDEHDIDVIVQPSPIRIYSDDDYADVGAKIQKDLSEAPVIFSVKEMPEEFFEEDKTYIFFSHTIKGQEHNMPMLKTMMEKKCNLIDYEKIENDRQQRLIFFGRYAGLAGAIETLWALGNRLRWEGKENPFEMLNHAYEYDGDGLDGAKNAIKQVGEKIKQDGIPEDMAPLIIGIAGYGHVSGGVQEILDLLPLKEIGAEEIVDVFNKNKFDTHHIYKVVFKEEDMVEPKSPDHNFVLQDYYDNPEKYRSVMETYLPYLTVLINSIYWDERYPRIITNDFIKRLFENEKSPVLKVVGDISCDLEGAIECTLEITKPDNPSFVYDPSEKACNLGYEGNGLVIMAVDNLPCEFPRESSNEFSHVLVDFVPEIVDADFSEDFENCDLPDPIKRAVILYHGELTPKYKYIEEFMD